MECMALVVPQWLPVPTYLAVYRWIPKPKLPIAVPVALLPIAPVLYWRALVLATQLIAPVVLALVVIIIVYLTCSNSMFSFASSTPKRRPRTGFTMIELLVVSTIIIVITAIGLVSYTQVNRNARNGKRRADLENVRQALVLYRTDNGTYPNTANYSDMLTTISAYISTPNIADPRNEAPYVYTYTAGGGGATFNLCANLEPTPTAYCVTNP